jgi:tight adherence protein B
MASIVIPALVFLIAVGAVVGLYAGALRMPETLLRRRLQRRIELVGAGGHEEAGEASPLVKGRVEGPLPAVDRLLGASARGSALARWIEQSGSKASLSAVVLMSMAASVPVGLAAGMLVRHPSATVVGGILGMAVPFLFLRQRRAKRFRRFEEQFPEALDLMSRALRAGHAFATGLKMVTDELDAPVGPEFRKIFDEQNFGLPIKDALANLTVRVPLIDVRFFATAVMIQRDTGGNLSEILENLAHVVRERFKILRQVRVYTAHGRMTGYVLLALPAVLAVALSFINPEHMNLLFRERMGQMLLGGALVMQFIGYMWIKQVVKIEV